MDKVRHIFSLLLVVLLLAAVAVNRDGRLFGAGADELFSGTRQKAQAEHVLLDNTHILSSEAFCRDVVGYAGPTPVQVSIKDGIVVKVEAMPNNETPSFFSLVTGSGLLDAWNGMTVEKALTHTPDAVSGATFSSNAVIANVQKTLEHATTIVTVRVEQKSVWGIKSVAALLVIALGVLIPIFAKSPKMRIVQLVLNVAVLGVWCGSFLSMSLFVGWISNGVNLAIALVPFTMLVVAVVLPFCGKKSHYCTWTCPMGSLQELLGRLNRRKLPIPQRLLRLLTHVRESILLILLMLMWLGVGFELMDYEAFSAFIFKQASWAVIALAGIFLVLSCFVNRPYCRFICPTGQLLAWSQKSEQ